MTVRGWLALGLAAALWGTPAPLRAQEPSDPVAAQARFEQETAPGLTARRLAAEERTRAATGYFAGELALAAAFPRWPAHQLLDPARLAAELARLDAAGVKRLRQRVEPPPGDLSEQTRAAWLEAHEATWSAEEEADALLRRLLLACRGLLQDPALRWRSQQLQQELTRASAALSARWSSSEDEAERAELELALGTTAQQERGLSALLADLIAQASVPGAPTPAIEALRLRWQTELPAAERLRTWRWLALSRALEHEELTRWWQENRLAPLTAERDEALAALTGLEDEGPPPADDATLSDWEARLVQVEEALAALPEPQQAPAGDALVALELSAAELRRARLEAEQRWLQRALESAAAADADARAARAEAAELDEAARALLEEGASGANTEAAQLLEARLGDRERTSEERQRCWSEPAPELRSLVDVEKDLSDIGPRLSALEASRSTLFELRENREVIADSYVLLGRHRVVLQDAALALVGPLDEAVRQEREVARRVAEQRSWRDEASDALPEAGLTDERRAEVEEGLALWQASLARCSTAAEERVELLRGRRDRIHQLLVEVHQLRRSVRSRVPRADFNTDQSRQLDALRAELRLLDWHLQLLLGDRAAALAAMPWRSFPDLWELARQGLWLVLGIGAWLWLRRRTDWLVSVLLGVVGSRERLYQHRRRELLPASRQVAVGLIDLAGLILLAGALQSPAPEVRLPLLLLRCLLLWRVSQRLYELIVSDVGDPRPALLRLGSATWRSARRGLRLLIAWPLLGWVLGWSLETLMAEALGVIQLRLFGLGWLALAVLELQIHEPALRSAIDRSSGSNRIILWLTRENASVALRWLRGLVALTLLGALYGWFLLARNVSDSSPLAPLFNLIRRRQFGRETASGEQLSPAVRKALRDAHPPKEHPELLARAREELTRWQTDRARGLMVVVGDPGQSQGRWLDQLLDQLEDTRIVRAQVPGRLCERGQMTAWLSEALKLGSATDGASVDESIRQLPRSVIVISDVQRGFLRRVGGFGGISQLVRTAADHSEEHFWILSLHRSAWSYLRRVGSVFKDEDFSAVLELPLLSADELSEHIIGLSRDAGFRPDWRELAQATQLGDQEMETRHAIDAFFQLLAESSGGNPGTALELWLDCLRRPPESNRLSVYLSRPIAQPETPELPGDELLMLAAVRLQGILTLSEVVVVNNTTEDQVHRAAQTLSSLGLLRNERGQLHIPQVALARVDRILKRQYFVYAG